MTKFKLNARLFGGFGLFLIFVVIIIPLYLIALESGVGQLPTNLLQTEEGVRIDQPLNPIPFIMVGGIAGIAIIFIFIAKKRRARS
jgi:hypothetical protein